MKRTSLVYYTPEAFYAEAEDAVCIARTEGLGAHAESLAVRMRKRQS